MYKPEQTSNTKQNYSRYKPYWRIPSVIKHTYNLLTFY
jgi:hypothetical protein